MVAYGKHVRRCRWCSGDHLVQGVYGHEFDGPRWSDGTLMLDYDVPPEIRGHPVLEAEWFVYRARAAAGG